MRFQLSAHHGLPSRGPRLCDGALTIRWKPNDRKEISAGVCYPLHKPYLPVPNEKSCPAKAGNRSSKG